ncbi:MAG: hypothetical protein ABFS37_09260, partial [Acidobacteriota bacterium]
MNSAVSYRPSAEIAAEPWFGNSDFGIENFGEPRMIDSRFRNRFMNDIRGTAMFAKDNLFKNRTAWILMLIGAAVLAANPGFTAEESESWKPDPPMPDKFDWVQMTSGEWLKGEI